MQLRNNDNKVNLQLVIATDDFLPPFEQQELEGKPEQWSSWPEATWQAVQGDGSV